MTRIADFGRDYSAVSVFSIHDGQAWACARCALSTNGLDFCCPTALLMLDHLDKHTSFGHAVPPGAFTRLRAVIADQTDEGAL